MFFLIYIFNKLFNLYLKIPMVLRRMVALKKGTYVQINNAMSSLSPPDSCPMLLASAKHKVCSEILTIASCSDLLSVLSFFNNTLTE